MSLESDIRLLSRVRLFEGFLPDQLRLLAFGAEARTIGAGTRLYQQDTYSDGGYVIVNGSIDLISGKDNTIVSTHTTGSLIGEMALISQIDHAATAIATEHSEVLKITRALFRRMIEEYPELADVLRDRISKDVNTFLSKLEIIRAKLDHASNLTNRTSKT